MTGTCIVCRNSISENAGIYINESNKTVHSGKDLLAFLINLLNEIKEHLYNNLICTLCLETINELDKVVERSRELTTIILELWKSHEVDISEKSKDVNVLQYDITDGNIEVKLETADKDIEFAEIKPEIEGRLHEEIIVPFKPICKNGAPTQTYICDVCGKLFKQKKFWKIHMDLHDGSKAHFCEICNKSFTQKISLMRHMPLHTDDYPHQCEMCGKRFKHHTSMGIHKLTHTGYKNYKCMFCEAAFMSSSHLKRHIKVHTGEKKFMCSVCGKKFAERYNLVSHEKIHLKQLPL